MALFARFSKAAVWLFIRTENLEQALVFRAQKGIKMVAVHLCPDYLNDTVSEPCLDKACVLDVCMNAATGNRHFFCFKCRIDPSSSPPSPDKIRLQRPRGPWGRSYIIKYISREGGVRGSQYGPGFV